MATSVTDKEIQIALGTYLPEVWKKRLELREQAKECHARAIRYQAMATKLFQEGKPNYRDVHDKEDEEFTEGDVLFGRADLMFIAAVKEVYGDDVQIFWTTTGCTLSNGLVFVQ